jgi:hypothetical protein
MSKHARRLVAALVLTLAAAFAAPVSATATPVDPEHEGSLTIHKYLVPEGSSINAGRPAEGVTFTVARVLDVDLTTSAGWETASELADGVRDVGPLDDARTAVTDAIGRAVFSDLALGLYRVTEATPPAGVDPITPFYVTVPLTDPEDGDRWLYDVHVYPKNIAPTDPGDPPADLVGPPANPPTVPPADADGGGQWPGPGRDQRADPVTPLRPGITGAETGMLTAVAVGLFAAGAWLAVLVGRIRRRREG